MKFFSRLMRALRSPRLPVDCEARFETAVDEIVAARSHGNVLLQIGKFYTKEDVDAEYEKK